jgi:hypothetical protein
MRSLKLMKTATSRDAQSAIINQQSQMLYQLSGMLYQQPAIGDAQSSMDNRQWALACEQWPSGNGLQAMGRGKQNATAVVQAGGRAIPKGA